MKKFFKDNLPKPEDIRKYKALGVLGESIFERELWSINKHTLISCYSNWLILGLDAHVFSDDTSSVLRCLF